MLSFRLRFARCRKNWRFSRRPELILYSEKSALCCYVMAAVPTLSPHVFTVGRNSSKFHLYEISALPPQTLAFLRNLRSTFLRTCGVGRHNAGSPLCEADGLNKNPQNVTAQSEDLGLYSTEILNLARFILVFFLRTTLYIVYI